MYATKPMPPMSWLLGLLLDGRPFSMPKILHGFWEKVLFHKNSFGLNTVEELVDSFSKQGFWANGYSTDHRQVLRYNPKYDWYYPDLITSLSEPKTDLFLGVSEVGYPGDSNSIFEPKRVASIIRQVITGSVNTHNGLFWKNAVMTGKAFEFWDALRESDLTVAAVGLGHLSGLGSRLHLPKFDFVEATMPIGEHYGDAIAAIHRHRDRTRGDVIYILQLGGSASAYAIYGLHGLVDATLIDMGRAIDAWTPEREGQLWWKSVPARVREMIP